MKKKFKNRHPFTFRSARFDAYRPFSAASCSFARPKSTMAFEFASGSSGHLLPPRSSCAFQRTVVIVLLAWCCAAHAPWRLAGQAAVEAVHASGPALALGGCRLTRCGCRQISCSGWLGGEQSRIRGSTGLGGHCRGGPGMKERPPFVRVSRAPLCFSALLLHLTLTPLLWVAFFIVWRTLGFCFFVSSVSHHKHRLESLCVIVTPLRLVRSPRSRPCPDLQPQVQNMLRSKWTS